MNAEEALLPSLSMNRRGKASTISGCPGPGGPIMMIYVHKDCGQPAVEMPDDFAPQAPSAFPLNCLHCLQEIESESDLAAVEQMGQ